MIVITEKSSERWSLGWRWGQRADRLSWGPVKAPGQKRMLFIITKSKYCRYSAVKWMPDKHLKLQITDNVGMLAESLQICDVWWLEHTHRHALANYITRLMGCIYLFCDCLTWLTKEMLIKYNLWSFRIRVVAHMWCADRPYCKDRTYFCGVVFLRNKRGRDCFYFDWIYTVINLT